VVYKVTTRL